MTAEHTMHNQKFPLPNYYLFSKTKSFYIYSLRCAFGYLNNTLKVC